MDNTLSRVAFATEKMTLFSLIPLKSIKFTRFKCMLTPTLLSKVNKLRFFLNGLDLSLLFDQCLLIYCIFWRHHPYRKLNPAFNVLANLWEEYKSLGVTSEKKVYFLQKFLKLWFTTNPPTLFLTTYFLTKLAKF